MKKKMKLLIIMGLAIAVLVAVLAVMQNLNAKKEAEAAAGALPIVFDVAKENMESVTYTYKGETVEMLYDASADKWYLADEPGRELKSSNSTGMSFALRNTAPERKLEMSGSLSDYGLDQPGITIYAKAKDREIRIDLGDNNKMTSCYYMTIEGDDALYLIPVSFASAFEYLPEDLYKE